MSRELFTICLSASNLPSSKAGPGEAISYLDCFYSALWIYFLAIFGLFQFGIVLKFYYKYKRPDGVSLKDYLWNKIVSVIDRSILKYYSPQLRNNLFAYTILCGGLYIAKPLATLFYVGVKNEFQLTTVNEFYGYLFFAVVEVSFSTWDIVERLFVILLLGCKNEILFIKNSQPNVPLDFTIQEQERNIFTGFLVKKTIGYYFCLFFSMLPAYIFIKRYQLNRNLSRTIYQFTMHGVTLGIALARMKYLFFFDKQMLLLNSKKLQEHSTHTILKQHLNEVKPTENLFNKLSVDQREASNNDLEGWKAEYGEKLTLKVGAALKNNFVQLSKKVELIRGQDSITIPRNPRDNSTITKFLVIYFIFETVTIMLYCISEYIRATDEKSANLLPLHQIILDSVLAVTDLISICFLPWLTKFLIENQYIFGDDPLRNIDENRSTIVQRENRSFTLRSNSNITVMCDDDKTFSRSTSQFKMFQEYQKADIS